MPSESVEAPEVSDIYVLVSHRLDGMLCFVRCEGKGIVFKLLSSVL